MQARFISLLAATAVVAAATFAFAGEQNTPQGVQTQPAEAGGYLLEIDGVKGESRDPPPPPPPPPPQNAPTAELGVVAPGVSEAALLVPAIQKVRDTAARAPQDDGVVVLDSNVPSGGASAPAPSDIATRGQGLMPELPICAHCAADVRRSGATESAPRDPEQPICAHCGSDVAAAPAAAATEERPRRRVFSLSIGGITVGSDGSVNVAVGDVTGDGQDDGAGQRPVRARSSQRR